MNTTDTRGKSAYPVRAARWATPRCLRMAVTASLLAWLPSMAAQRIEPLTPAPTSTTGQLVTEHPSPADRFAQSETTLRLRIETDPKAPDPRYRLAYILLREGKAADALKEYTAAAALRPPNAEELRDVALAYVLLKDYPDAELWLNRSLAMNGADAETWYVMGRLHYTQLRYGDALACFQKTLEFHPRSVKGENNLGLAYEALNRDEDAVRAYRTAIDWQKSDPAPSAQPLLNLAILLVHRSQAAEAQDLLERALAMAPKEPRIHENLGQVYLRQGRTADATKEFATAVALEPENPRYHYLLGQACRRGGDNMRAKEEFARSAALNGTHSTPTPE